jgi:hypothetical protein
LEGGSYFCGVEGLWQLIMSMRLKKRVEKGEESRGKIGGFWLNHDREERAAIEEFKEAEHEWFLWEGLETEKD